MRFLPFCFVLVLTACGGGDADVEPNVDATGKSIALESKTGADRAAQLPFTKYVSLGMSDVEMLQQAVAQGGDIGMDLAMLEAGGIAAFSDLPPRAIA